MYQLERLINTFGSVFIPRKALSGGFLACFCGCTSSQAHSTHYTISTRHIAQICAYTPQHWNVAHCITLRFGY